jgi:hypothetical protein
MLEIIIDGKNAIVDNIQDIEIISAFADGNGAELEMNVSSLIVKLETRQQLLSWVQSYGVMVGIPTVVKQGTLTLNYYIDLSDSPRFSDHEIECKIKKRKGKDNFLDIANGATFEYLAAEGVLFPTRNVPYVIIPDNQLELGVTLSISIFVIFQTIKNEAQKLAALGVQFAFGVSGFSVAQTLAASANILLQAAKVVLLVIEAKKLVDQLKELIFPKVRFFMAATVKDLLSSFCVKYGYTFKSTLLDSLADLTILPVPLIKEKKSIFDNLMNALNLSFTKGYPTSSDTTPTAGSLLAAMESTFNAKTKVRNGLVELEREDFWADQSAVELKSSLTDQEKRVTNYTFNTNDAWSRQVIKYLPDYSDIHTLDIFESSYSEKGTKNINQIDNDLNLIAGFKDIEIPFAQGVRKNDFSYVEQIALDLFSLFSEFTSVTTNIKNRVGVLQVSQQFFSKTKLLLLTNDKQPVDYQSIIGAPALADNYYQVSEIQNDSHAILEMPFEMDLAQFEQIIYQEYINLDGVNVEIIDMTYNLYSRWAIIKFKKPDNWGQKISTFVVG